MSCKSRLLAFDHRALGTNKTSHLNSIDKNAEGDYLLSFRHTDALYLVSGIDGHIIWRLGGTNSTFVMLDGLRFSRQHHARWIRHDNNYSVISIMDNASGEPESHSTPPTSPVSRGITIELHHNDGEPYTARAIRIYDRPDGALSMLRGNMQTLANGNVLMGWSQSGYLSEHTEDGDCIMEAGFASDRFSSYRQYKFEFEGAPSEAPIAVASAYRTANSFVTICHVSWNGATQVASWNFYGNGSVLLGNEPRSGFETMFLYDGLVETVWAEALDADGNVLGKSREKDVMLPKQWEADDGSPAPSSGGDINSHNNQTDDHSPPCSSKQMTPPSTAAPTDGWQGFESPLLQETALLLLVATAVLCCGLVTVVPFFRRRQHGTVSVMHLLREGAFCYRHRTKQQRSRLPRG
jgi:hypothetical protein